MNSNWRYENIFLYSSLQFCGNIEIYFASHTKKLLVYIVMPRLRNEGNLLRIYNQGKLTQELKVTSSDNLILYYVYWFIGYWTFILRFYKRQENFLVLASHPITFFAMFLQKLLRPKISFAYWIGDYFPPVHWSLIMFEKLKKYYHDRVDFNFYLSDTLQKIFNRGQIIESKTKKTVMWGVKPVQRETLTATKSLQILFVGLIKYGQGLEAIFEFLSTHPQHKVNIIGVCAPELYLTYKNIISKLGIESRVFFPNKFYSEEELKQLSKSCHIGIALYDMSKINATYYTDPGKVKTYAELGLPVVMSNTSSIAPFIKKFKAGEIVTSADGISDALLKITQDYRSYVAGLKKFNAYFFYETYYQPKFVSLETV